MALTKVRAGGLTLSDNFAFTGTVSGVASIGVSQTWQDLTSSRSHGTNYTNSTGRAIMVSVCTNMATNSRIDSTVGGVDIQDNGISTVYGGMGFNIFIVPDNTVYKVDRPQGTIQYWAELR